MNWTGRAFAAAVIIAFTLLTVSCEYSETVTVTYLPNSNILTEATFKLSSEFPSSNTKQRRDLGYFPSLIYALPTEFGLLEGKLAFTRGLWQSNLWGKSPSNPSTSGFQFHGHFTNDFKELTIEERFDRTIELISGYFCASLNSLKYSQAIKPTLPSFPSTSSHSTTLIGLIPNEPLCIENLLPWLNLLPCGNRAGFAEMFLPEKIYQSDFHAIELEFSSRDNFIEMSLKMFTVYNLNQWDRNNNWSITSLFGKSFKKSCPIVSGSEPKLVLRIPNKPEYIDSLHQHVENASIQGDHLIIEYTGKYLLSEIGASNLKPFKKHINPAVPFRAYRFKSGTTDDFGGFGLVLENDSEEHLEVGVIESIPWLFKVFLHRGEFALNSQSIHPSDLTKYLKKILIEPAINRKRSLLLQTEWTIPPKSRLQIYFPFEREFLRIDEFPANSERGIEMPGALIFYKQSKYGKVYSETTNTLLFTWPIPDGTMPFNVITMTSTLAALFYGSFFNIIFRRYYLKHPNDPPPGVIPKILWKLKNMKNKQQ